MNYPLPNELKAPRRPVYIMVPEYHYEITAPPLSVSDILKSQVFATALSVGFIAFLVAEKRRKPIKTKLL